jgi:hypothetical protein
MTTPHMGMAIGELQTEQLRTSAIPRGSRTSTFCFLRRCGQNLNLNSGLILASKQECAKCPSP